MKSSSLFQGFDHLEFFVGNAKQATFFYTQALGFRQTAYRGPETGDQKVVSYLLEQGQIRLVLSSALNADHAIARDVALHGDTLAVLAFEVIDVEDVYRQIQHKLDLNELRPELVAMLQLQPPTVQIDASGEIKTTELRVFGNVSLKFIERSTYDGCFAPYFVASSAAQNAAYNVAT
ncbi:MAG: VOC family protein, partial [Cyanobacteria bacterium P01_H01_bin.121]